jgi:hypothetical protein
MRVTVGPTPYGKQARETYQRGWRTAAWDAGHPVLGFALRQLAQGPVGARRFLRLAPSGTAEIANGCPLSAASENTFSGSFPLLTHSGHLSASATEFQRHHYISAKCFLACRKWLRTVSGLSRSAKL